jgi:hypothetical protein
MEASFHEQQHVSSLGRRHDFGSGRIDHYRLRTERSAR